MYCHFFSKMDSTLPNENKLIVQQIKRYEALYNKYHVYYLDDEQKTVCFESIAEDLNKTLHPKKPFTGTSVKQRWENLRKAYVRDHKKVLDGQKSSYYLYNHMDFLTSFVTHTKKRKFESDNKSLVDYASESSSLLSSEDSNNEELTFSDVLSLYDKSKKHNNSNKKLNQNSIVPGKSTSASNSVHTDTSFKGNNFSPTAQSTSTNFEKIIIPENDAFAKKKIAANEKLEETIVKAMNKAGILIDSLCQDDHDNDVYIQSIAEALKTIPQEKILDCVNGILTIIHSFIEKNSN